MIWRVVGEVSIVNPGTKLKANGIKLFLSLLASIVIGARVVWSDISSTEVWLTVRDSSRELSGEHWQLTQVDVVAISGKDYMITDH